MEDFKYPEEWFADFVSTGFVWTSPSNEHIFLRIPSSEIMRPVWLDKLGEESWNSRSTRVAFMGHLQRLGGWLIDNDYQMIQDQ